MRVRINYFAFIIFATVCFWVPFVTFRQDCSLPNVSGDVSPATAFLSSEKSFAADGFVLDCITWDRKLQSAKYEKLIVQDFRVNQTLAAGESADKRRLFFHRIFAARDWPADDPSYHGLKASGPGSMLHNAQNMIAILHSVISRVKSHLGKSSVSILDAACGDMQWMPYVLGARSDVVYTGADIVPDIIALHRKKFKKLQNAKFVEHDFVSKPLNRSYDIVLVRDALQHLYITDAMIAVKRLSESGSKFLLATTFPDIVVNAEVDKSALGGRKSSYNLERSPFSLEPPICSSYDWNVEHIGLWKLPLKQIMM